MRHIVTFFIFLFIFLSGLVFFSSTAAAAPPLQKMAESDLEEIVAGSFSRFTMEEIGGNHFATVDLNIRAEIHAEIDSFYSHYAPDAQFSDSITSGSDWDQHWENVIIGESVENPFKVGHFFLQAEFENFNAPDPADKRLVSLTVGFKNADGDLTADFYSLTRGDIAAPWYRREINSGNPATYEFDAAAGHQFLFQFVRSEDIDGSGEYRPITRVDFGGAGLKP